MEITADLERFPIRVLAEKTGVGTSTIRAWERRYGLLKPERTPKGHRLYKNSDSQRIMKILDLLNDGHSLPMIAQLLSTTINSLDTTAQAKQDTNFPTAAKTIWHEFIQSTLEAVSDFSIERIEAIYNEASSLYPVDFVTDHLIQPTLTILGEAWKNYPERGIAEEHLYTSWLKNRLGARFHHAYSQARGTRVVCACVPGSYHEIGLMLFSLSALARGYRVLYFGADLPFHQLGYIIQRSAARAVVLGAQTQLETGVNRELSNLIPQLKVPVFIGGSNESLNSTEIQSAGGILLGTQVSVAMKVFEGHLPAHRRQTSTEAG